MSAINLVSPLSAESCNIIKQPHIASWLLYQIEKLAGEPIAHLGLPNVVLLDLPIHGRERTCDAQSRQTTFDKH